MNIHTPTAEFCFGRNKIVNEIINLTISEGVTFLFGGRQSGKTTILLRIQKTLQDQINSNLSSLDIIIPIYVNLLSLPYNATPENFFQLLTSETINNCEKIFGDFSLELTFSDSFSRDSLKSFEDNIGLLIKYFKDKHITFFYLIDESKKIFRDGYITGLNDNLFYAFYVSEKISGNISAVFSGSQELYELIEDEGTSPLGSRANLEYLTSLSKEAIGEMISSNVQFADTKNKELFIEELYIHSGGHAGICAYITKKCAQDKAEPNIEILINQFLEKHSHLFNIWHRSLSPEAIIVHDYLIKNSNLDTIVVPEILRANKLNSLHSDWAIKQILFTGIAYVNSDLISANDLYKKYIKKSQEEKSEEEISSMTTNTIPNELIKSAQNGDLIIFCGAGLSMGAGLPSWLELVEPLAKEIGRDLPNNKNDINALHLLDTLQAYEKVNGTNSLIAHIRDAVDTNGKSPTLVHQAISSIPNIKKVFTTNYDDLIERAFKDSGKKINKIINKENIAFMDSDRIQIVKLCGDPEDPKSLVVTRSQFNYVFSSRTKVLNLLSQSLEKHPTLFLGYSLKDPFFSQIWDTIGFEFEEFRPLGYVIMFNCTNAEKQELEDRQFKVINISVGAQQDKTSVLEKWLRDLISLV